MSVLAAIWAVAMMTAPGRVGYYYFFIYAEFYMGVVALVSLSITIMVGLVATDRLVLSIRQRVLLQSAHRTTGVIAVTALFVHVWTKVVESHISIIDAFIPFMAAGNKLYVGLGTISGWIMVLVMWTGIARSRFVGHGKPWMWRAIHAISYLMWPIALTHGLSAGRPAATWVVVSYIVCILGVLIGLAVRLSVSLNRNKDFASQAGAGGLKPVGTLVPTSSPAMKRPGRRERAPEPEPQTLGPVAVVDTFRPVTPPPAPPVEDLVVPAARFDEPTGMMARPDFEDEMPRGRRRVEDDIEYDEPLGRRYAAEDTGTRMRMEDTGTRMRRPDYEDTGTRMRRADYEDTGTRMRRDDLEDTGTRMRRAERDDRGYYDEPPAPRQRGRYADEDDMPPPRRSRRQGDMPLSGGRIDDDRDYDDVPRQRGRYADEEPPARRSRGRGADVDRADSGRHSRSGFVEFAGDDETPTLVDMASRRTRRGERDEQEPVRVQAGRGARRDGRGRADDDVADDAYWSQLRGEAN
ncbi:translation initiation factor III [Paractinoplanes atraurantiacus]|uniref:translation initiation factor III n=1 Tax=Paractinoplanes atraurantiacus TaxID=1036182 RepID=UPI001FE60506|nr:translation initiation factor III [Actinoplanes atraurantiacus]